jgi:hypothetical protein
MGINSLRLTVHKLTSKPTKKGTNIVPFGFQSGKPRLA